MVTNDDDDDYDYYYDENDGESDDGDDGTVKIATAADAYAAVYGLQGPEKDDGGGVVEDITLGEDVEEEEEEEAAADIIVADDEDPQKAEARSENPLRPFSEAEPDPLHNTYYQSIATYANDIETCTIVRSDERITSDYITKYELAQVLAQRVKEIEASGKHYLVGGEVPTDVDNIALLEVKRRRCPLSILRRLESNVYEKWDVNELNLPEDCSL
ncbi:MAG TPA: hypothetical protein VFQ26_09140 [Nitrospiraceae bacterium]|nr:hypothetical protein [Nitrospiraceae bacterium]